MALNSSMSIRLGLGTLQIPFHSRTMAFSWIVLSSFVLFPIVPSTFCSALFLLFYIYLSKIPLFLSNLRAEHLFSYTKEIGAKLAEKSSFFTSQ